MCAANSLKELIRRWQGGAVITLCWHAVRPTEDEPVTFADSVQGHLTDGEFDALLTPGTPIHKHWCVQVDIVRPSTSDSFKDARVPVLVAAIP